LAAVIREHRGAETVLHKGSGGQFEVVVDGKLIFSKKAEHRFPDPKEILDQIPAAT
jgi:selT/selW/selH-like putative selenoprotein